MNPRPKGDRPEYKVYRSRRRGRLGSAADGLKALKSRGAGRSEAGRRPPSRASGRRAPITGRRVLRWVALGVGGWILLSFLLFMVSAQLEGGVSSEAKAALDGSGNFFGGSTVLVLGSDQRGGDSIDSTQSGAPRADSIMLVHAQLGGVRKLSIPRDASANIPGFGTQKINGAYAFGGPSLMIETVEGFMGNGLKIDHLIEVDFEDFPEFIDAMGGITVNNKTKICAPEFDNFFRGFNLKKGRRELNGRRALGFARVRKNPCAIAENDLNRAERQQEVLNGIRGQLLSASTLFRLPLISWKAPKTIRTDLRGPGLLALAADIATGGSGEPAVLQPSVFGNDLEFSDAEKTSAVQELLGEG